MIEIKMNLVINLRNFQLSIVVIPSLPSWLVVQSSVALKFVCCRLVIPKQWNRPLLYYNEICICWTPLLLLKEFTHSRGNLYLDRQFYNYPTRAARAGVSGGSRGGSKGSIQLPF